MTHCTIVIPAADLLSAIWYSDGSGVRGEVPLTDPSTSWEIESIEYVEDSESQVVALDLVRRHNA